MSTPAHTSGPGARLAVALSVIPGGGQLYTRQPGKALYYLVWTTGLIAGSILLLTRALGFGHDLIGSGAVAAALLIALGVIVVFLGLFICGLFFWASAAVDAWTSAREIREGGAASADRRHFRL